MIHQCNPCLAHLTHRLKRIRFCHVATYSRQSDSEFELPMIAKTTGPRADLGEGAGGAHPAPPGVKPSSSYSLLKFVYLTSQWRHSLVVHPLPEEKSWIRLCERMIELNKISSSFNFKYCPRLKSKGGEGGALSRMGSGGGGLIRWFTERGSRILAVQDAEGARKSGFQWIEHNIGPYRNETLSIADVTNSSLAKI